MRLLFAAVLTLAVPALAAAQTAIPPAFLGTWMGMGLNPAPSPLGAPASELPWAALDKAIGDYMLPWAIAKQQSIEWNVDDTGQVCKPTGIFRQGNATGAGFRLVEAAPGTLYQVGGSIDQRGVQRIYFDVPRSRTPQPTWNGEARGRFEGTDTLIVDSIARPTCCPTCTGATALRAVRIVRLRTNHVASSLILAYHRKSITTAPPAFGKRFGWSRCHLFELKRFE